MYRATSLLSLLLGLATIAMATSVTMLLRAKAAAAALWGLLAALGASLVGAPACKATSGPEGESVTGTSLPAEQPTAGASGAATSAPPSTKGASLSHLEQVERALDELGRLRASGAISAEVYALRHQALEAERAGLMAPAMSELVKTPEWGELVQLWNTLEELERRNLKSDFSSEVRNGIYTQAEALLKAVRENESVIDRMQAKGLLSARERLLLFTVLGTRLDGLAEANAPHTCYDRPLPPYSQHTSSRVETHRAQLAALHEYRAAGVIDAATYRVRKTQLEQAIATSEQVARPTGRAALILAALAGVRPASGAPGGATSDAGPGEAPAGARAAPGRRAPWVYCYAL